MKYNALFTFVLDYRGGTYISQRYGVNIQTVIENWIKDVKLPIRGFTKSERNIALRFLHEDVPPTALDGVSNVWCFGIEIKGKTGLIHVIKSYTP